MIFATKLGPNHFELNTDDRVRWLFSYGKVVAMRREVALSRQNLRTNRNFGRTTERHINKFFKQRAKPAKIDQDFLESCFRAEI